MSVPEVRPAPAVSTESWWRRPLRAVHTVLREPDAADFDLPGVLEWLHRWRVNVYAVNGGGLCAFYKSRVSFHRHNRFLGDRDLFPEIVDACHRDGIKVVARMDFRGAHQDLFEAHPEWFGRDDTGAPRTNGGLYAACPNSPFRNDGYAFDVVREVLERCGADGIWENAAAFGGRCACPTCRQKLRDETGIESIPQENWEDPAWRRYVRWRYDCVREHTRRLRDVVKSCGVEKSYGGEFFTFLEPHARESAEDVAEIADLWDYQMACIFPLTRGSCRSPLLPVPVWRAEEQMKYLRATGGGNTGATARERPQTPVMLYGHFDNTSRYTTPAPHELDLWLAGMAAQGGAPWDCSFVGVPPSRWWDRRHYEVVERHYHFLAEHERAFAALESVAEVAVLHSQRTQDRFPHGDSARDGYATHVRGWELALFAGHLQWDVLPEPQVQLDVLRRYRAVVLANVACVSDEMAAVLREYVAQGGALLGTYESGCYLVDGARRESGVLDDVFGVQGLGLAARGPLPYSYTRLRTHDALTAGFEDTDVVTNEGFVRPVTLRDGAAVHATLVPEIVPQPPDLSYPTLWDNDAPLLVSNRFGRGRAVYFANQVDRLNVTSGHPDYERLLADALAWALDLDRQPPLVETEASGDVHVTLLRQPATGTLYLHLVNYTGARGRPVVAPLPVGPLSVTLHLPTGLPAPANARALVAAQPVPLEPSDTGVRFTLPALGLREVVELTP